MRQQGDGAVFDQEFAHRCDGGGVVLAQGEHQQFGQREVAGDALDGALGAGV